MKNFLSIIIVVSMIIWCTPTLNQLIQTWVRNKTYRNIKIEKLALLIAIINLALLCIICHIPLLPSIISLGLMIHQYIKTN